MCTQYGEMLHVFGFDIKIVNWLRIEIVTVVFVNYYHKDGWQCLPDILFYCYYALVWIQIYKYANFLSQSKHPLSANKKVLV